jgi:hypothetical protein
MKDVGGIPSLCSVVGCVADWQQETRSPSNSPVIGTKNQFALIAGVSMSVNACYQHSVLTATWFERTIPCDERDKMWLAYICFGDFRYGHVCRIFWAICRGHVLPEADPEIDC